VTTGLSDSIGTWQVCCIGSESLTKGLQEPLQSAQW